MAGNAKQAGGSLKRRSPGGQAKASGDIKLTRNNVMVDTTTTQHTGNTTRAIHTIASATQQLVRVFDGQIGGLPAQVCDGRELHAFLKAGWQFSDWIKKRIEQYGFEENLDYARLSPSDDKAQSGGFSVKTEKPRGGRPSIEYHLSLDMAKELSMVENNEQGRTARRYFIDCEKRAHAPITSATLPAEDWDQVAFEGKRIRVVMRDGQPWLAAANVAAALGLRSSDRITRAAARTEVCTTKRGRQSLNFLSPSAAFRASDYAEHERGARWRSWLARTLGELQGKQPAPPAPQAPQISGDPAELLRGMIGSNRFLCHLDERGRITLREIPQCAVLANVEHLADWIADPSGPPQRLLPGILAAVAQRMQQAA